jgi:hypothetical protein
MGAISYTAEIELDMKATVKSILKVVDDWMEGISQWHGAVAGTPAGRAQITLTLPAESLAQAHATALLIAERVTGRAVVASRVRPTADFDAEFEDLQVIPPLMSVAGAAKEVGVSPQRLRDYLEDGRLPHRRVDARTTVILASAVTRLAAKDRRAGRPPRKMPNA